MEISEKENGNGNPVLEHIHIESLLRELEILKQDKHELEEKRFIDGRLAAFVEVLRWRIDDTLSSWADRVLTEIVQSVEGLQGSFYVWEEEQNHLRLVAGYASPPETPQTLAIGVGVSGQAVKTRQFKYFENQDTFYAFNYSSLSRIQAQALAIAPLIYNETVEGLLEISATRPLARRAIDLIKSLSESIAANLSTIRNQEKIQKLYQEAQVKSAALLTQEEELRQNLEELQATQEQMRLARAQVESNQRFIEAALNSTNIMFIATDAEGIVRFWNEAAVKQLGYSVEETVGKLTQTVFHDIDEIVEEAARLSEVYQIDLQPGFEVFKTAPYRNDKYEREWTYIRKNGERFPVNLNITAWRAGDGTTGLIGIAQDITDRKHVQDELQRRAEELKQNFEKLQAAQEQMRRAEELATQQRNDISSIINAIKDNIVAVDINYDIIYFNETNRALMAANGIVQKIGVPYQSVVSPSEWEKIKSLWDRAFAGEVFTEDISYYFETTGQTFYYELNYNPLYRADGSVSGAVLCARDVTLIKEAQNAQERQRREIEALINSTDDLVVSVSVDWKLLYFNEPHKQYVEKRGMPQYVGMDYWEMVPLQEHEGLEALWTRTFKGEKYSIESQFQFEGDRLRDYVFSFSPLYTPEGAIKGGVLFVREITDVRDAQRAIERQHQKLLTIANTIQGNIALFSKEQKLIFFNNGYSNAFAANGVAIKEGMAFEDFVNENEMGWVLDCYNRALGGDDFSQEISYKFTEDAIDTFYYLSSWAPYKDNDGSIIGVILFTRDITDRKKIELEVQQKNEELEAQSEELRQNLEELAATQEQMRAAQETAIIQRDEIKGIIDSLPDLLMVVDQDLRLQHFNEAYRVAMSSQGIQVEPGMALRDAMAPQDWDKYKHDWLRVLAGEQFSNPLSYPLPDGGFLYMNLHYTPLKRADGHVFAALLIIQDVSASKRIEVEVQQKNEELEAQAEELRQNLEELSATQDQMRAAQEATLASQQQLLSIADSVEGNIALFDLTGSLLFCNEGWRTVFKANNIELSLGMHFNDFITPDQLEWFENSIKRVGQGEAFSDEVAYKFYPDATELNYYLSSWSPYRDVNNKVIGAVILGRDITARKNIELAVAAQRDEIQNLVNNIEGQIICVDPDFRILYYNEAATQTMPGIQVGVLMEGLIDAQTWAYHAPARARAVGGEHFADEFDYIIPQTNQAFYFRVHYIPMRDNEGKVTQILIHTYDITERKSAELQIIAQKNEIQKLVNNIEGQIICVDTDFRILYYNEAAMQTMPGIQVGVLMEGLVDPDVWAFHAPTRKRASDGEHFVHEFDYTIPQTNQSFHFRLHYIPMRDNEGKITQILIHTYDITERKSAELQIIAQRDEIQGLINNLEGLLLYVDNDYKIRLFNEAQKQLLNSQGIDVQPGMDFKAIINPAEWESVKIPLERAYAGEKFSHELEYKFENNPNSYYFSIEYSPVRGANNEVIGLLVHTRDVTTRKKAELETEAKNKQLLQQNQEFAALYAAIDFSFIIVEFDVEGNFLKVNEQYARLLGYTPEEMIGKNYAMVLPRDYASTEPYKQFWQNLRAGKVYKGEVLRIRKDGSKIWFQATYKPMQDAEGNVYKVLKIGHDATRNPRN